LVFRGSELGVAFQQKPGVVDVDYGDLAAVHAWLAILIEDFLKEKSNVFRNA